MSQPPFEIKDKIASNGRVIVTSSSDKDTKLFRRRAIKKDVVSGKTTQLEFCVVELNGVRAYVYDDGVKVSVVLSDKDLYP